MSSTKIAVSFFLLYIIALTRAAVLPQRYAVRMGSITTADSSEPDTSEPIVARTSLLSADSSEPDTSEPIVRRTTLLSADSSEPDTTEPIVRIDPRLI